MPNQHNGAKNREQINVRNENRVAGEKRRRKKNNIYTQPETANNDLFIYQHLSNVNNNTNVIIQFIERTEMMKME